MSDNPYSNGDAEEILAQLRLEVDAADANASVDQFAQNMDDTAAAAQKNWEQLASAAEAYTQSTVEAQNTLNEMLGSNNEQIRTFNDQLKQTQTLVETISSTYTLNSTALDQMFGISGTGGAGTALTAPDLSGGGGSGDGSDAGDGGGGGTGGLFGAARGIRAGAGLARMAGLGTEGTNALTGTADIIYLQQGFQKISDILPTLNAGLTTTAGQLPLVGDALGALDLGMAPLIVTAGALVAVVGVAALAITEWNNQQKEDIATIKELITTDEEYFKAIQTGTKASIQAEIDKEKATQDGIQGSLNDLKGQYAIQQTLQNEALAGNTGLSAAGNAIAIADTGAKMKNLSDQMKPLQDELDKSTAKIKGLQDAQGSDQVAANDAAAALREHLQIQDQLSKVFVADDAMTTAEIKKHSDEVANQINTVQANIQALQTQSAGLDKASEGYLKNQQAIQTYQNQLALLEPEYEHLTGTSLELAQARDVEKTRTADLKKAVDEYVKTMDSQQNVLDQLSAAQANWAQQAQDTAAARNEQTKQQTADFNANELETEQTYQENRATKVANFNAGIADLEATANDSKAKTIADAQVAQAQAQQDLAAKIAEIWETARDNELDAASHLDARKVAQEERKAAESVKKAEQSYNQTEARRAEAEQRKLAQDDANTAKEIEKRQDAFDKQLALDNQHEAERKEKAELKFQESQAKQQETWAKQDKATADQHAKEISALEDHLLKLQETQNNAWTRIESNTNISMENLNNIVTGNLQNMATAAQNIFSQIQTAQAQGGAQPSQQTTNPYGSVTTNNAPITGGSSSGGGDIFGSILGGIGSFLGFAEGGTVPGTPIDRNIVKVGERGAELALLPGGTQILNHQQISQGAAGGGGGPVYNVNIDGRMVASKPKLKELLVQVINEAANA